MTANPRKQKTPLSLTALTLRQCDLSDNNCFPFFHCHSCLLGGLHCTRTVFLSIQDMEWLWARPMRRSGMLRCPPLSGSGSTRRKLECCLTTPCACYLVQRLTRKTGPRKRLNHSQCILARGFVEDRWNAVKSGHTGPKCCDPFQTFDQNSGLGITVTAIQL